MASGIFLFRFIDVTAYSIMIVVRGAQNLIIILEH